MQDWQARLNIKNIVLNNESNWIHVILSQEEVDEGIKLGTLQQSESKTPSNGGKPLHDNSFSGDEDDALARSIAAKQAEFAVRKWGGGTARVVNINEFHDYPDVGQVNVRYTFNPSYGMVLTKKDQGKVPMVLVTGKCPDFYLMGWFIPDYAKQIIYKIHQGRTEDCKVNYGFFQNMKDHECCQVNMQMLFPMWSFNKELIK